MCTHSCLFSTFFLLDTLLLHSSCRHEGVRSALPGLRGLLGVRLPADVPVAPCSASDESYRLCFTLPHTLYQTFVIIVINNIRTHFIISFYVICAVIYCSFYCIYVWLDPGTYMIARFMFFYKPGVTSRTDRSDRFIQPVGPVGATLPTPPVRPVCAKQKGWTLCPQVYNPTIP